tara:strand:+ start:28 stop:2418 length:2391 start_codon:yes stop_codon:yes gene_type:complete
MAETRQERQERIALSNAEREAREQEIIKGLPTLGWMAGLGLPGAGITDTLGLYPADTSGSGEMLPSFGQNIADKNYLDALYQGMGLFGDAAYASIPVTGPMGVLAGTALKGASIAGKASRGAKVVDRAQKLINQGKASAGTEGATKKMVAETKIPEGRVVDVRKNLNSSFDDPELEKFKAQTIHDVKTLKDGSVSGSESSIGTGSAISYDPAVTLKSNGTPIELKVNQVARDQIASKTKPKFPMAAVRGIHDDVDIFEPDLVLGFNPMRHNVFVDESGYGVKSIKNGKTTIIDNDVMVKLDNPDAFRVVEDVNGEQIKLYDDIEYYSVDDLPATNNPSEAKGIAALPESITAYHGSGADFDKFNIRKIGSGEGLQAYGRGLYFAEEEDVAKVYRDAIGGRQVFYNGKPVKFKLGSVSDLENPTGDITLDTSLMMMQEHRETPEGFIKYLEDEAIETPHMKDHYQQWAEKIRKVKDKITLKSTGKLYEAKLKVTPDELLDLDKPLNKQSKVVQEKIDELLKKPVSEFDSEYGSGTLEDTYLELVKGYYPDLLSEAIARGYRGDEFRTMLEEIVGYRGASEALESVGIKGNKYKDEFSRSLEGGTSNFVIFDDRVIDISKKYGITIPMAGAMLMAEDYKNTVEAEEFNQGGEVENDVSAYLRFYQYAKDAGLQFPEAVAAQASLESGHGKSDLAIYQNNVLGIKPDDSSQASESYDTLEYINGEPVVINDLFRTFDSQEDSFAGYKDKIDKPRYEDAKGSGTPEDYLMAIDEAGYATDPDYAEKVIGIMNRYNSYLEN